MKILVTYQDASIDRLVVEEVTITPQGNNEVESILRDMNVSRVSEDGYRRAIQNGALDLTPRGRTK